MLSQNSLDVAEFPHIENRKYLRYLLILELLLFFINENLVPYGSENSQQHLKIFFSYSVTYCRLNILHCNWQRSQKTDNS
jgi:hypothetical protein